MKRANRSGTGGASPPSRPAWAQAPGFGARTPWPTVHGDADDSRCEPRTPTVRRGGTGRPARVDMVMPRVTVQVRRSAP